MSSAGFTLHQEALPLQRQVKTLINDDLKRILRSEGLAVAGVKAQLQDRILMRLNDYVVANNVQPFNRLRHRILNPRSTTDPPTTYTNSASHSSHNQSSASPVHATAPYNHTGGYRPPGPPPAMRRLQLFPPRFYFKDSPFYEVEGNVTTTAELTKCESHRQSHSLKLEPNPAMFDEPGKRIMLYCAAEPIGGAIRSDIAFPHQLEIKVNNQDVRANFRGLKNRPGSTRPADITTLLSHSQMNVIQVTYALTQKRFYIMAVLVRKRTVDELVEKISRGRIITKQSVLTEMRNKAADPDIIATSTVMSLKDPVSAMRISVPCRSNVCTHNQCFDAASFLQLQEQAPTWTCPICNKVVDFAGLAVDQYVQEILQSTSKSIDQVTIEPNGAWIQGSQSGSSRRDTQSKPSPASDDDDVVEITDHRLTNIKNETVQTPPSLFGRTPPASSREASTPTSAQAPRSASKRKSEVIDLTLSSDDEEPVRPTKRYQSYSISLPPANGYRAPSSVLPSPSVSTGTSFQAFHMPNRSASNGVTLPSHQGHPTMRTHNHYGGYIGPGGSSSPPNS